MRKIILIIVALGLVFGLVGCSSEADKKAKNFVGAWSDANSISKGNILWNRYFLIKKIDGQKDLFEVKEIEYAIKDDGATKKGKINQYRDIAKIDENGILRFHGKVTYLVINSEGNEFVESNKNKFTKINGLPEELKNKK